MSRTISFLGDENRFLNNENVWNNIHIDKTIIKSPARYYAAIRENYNQIKVKEFSGGKTLFGIKIEITAPYASRPATIIKPLLNGIICAFHGEDGVAKNVLRDIFKIRSELMLSGTNKLNILGKREYIKRYRGGSFKWNQRTSVCNLHGL